MTSHFLAFISYLLLILYFFRIKYLDLIKNLLAETMQSKSILLDKTKTDKEKEEQLQKKSLDIIKLSFFLVLKTLPIILLAYLAYYILPDMKFAILYPTVAFLLVYKLRN